MRIPHFGMHKEESHVSLQFQVPLPQIPNLITRDRKVKAPPEERTHLRLSRAPSQLFPLSYSNFQVPFPLQSPQSEPTESPFTKV